MERYKVLLVEDDEIVAMDSRHRLEGFGYEVVAVASDGETAIAAFREASPDVVLMNIGLPGKTDGIEAAAKIREIRDVPVIYLTAYEDDGTLGRAKVTEPQGYLVKPSTDREIRITIELAVYRHAMERERARLQAQVKRLEGIIPICSACKKIRTSAGYWRQVETYLSEHTDARFSHSLCPDCLVRMWPPSEYPELYEDGHLKDFSKEDK